MRLKMQCKKATILYRYTVYKYIDMTIDCSVPVTDVFVPVVFACFVHMNFQFLFILFPYISEHLPLFSMLIGQTRFHSVHIYVRMCVHISVYHV